MKKFIKKVMCLGAVAGLLLESFPVWALVKDETIYARLENNGQVNKIIVSEHLQGTGENETTDKSRLDNITNVNGDEKFTNENGKIVWESNGKDIYYQGETKEQLPISLKITYYLNGVESTVKEMIGKKGTVKIVFKYTNNDKHEEMINGKYSVLYTPFVVATTTILPNDTNSNIKVKNGKVIANGTKSIVVLLSTPGLYESLGIDKLKGMDEAEISFETDSFELSSIYSVSTPKLIDKSDLDIFNNIDGIYNSINTLVDSSNKLKNGSGQILNGAEKLKDGVNKLKDGINSAYNGSKQITDIVSYSIDALNKDNTPSISDEKLAVIRSQAESLAKQGVEAKFSKAETKNGIEAQAEQTVIDSFDADKVTEIEDEATTTINEIFTNAYKDGIGKQAVQTLNADNDYQTLKTNVNALITGYESNATFMALYNACEADPTLADCQTNQASIGSYKVLKVLITTIEGTTYSTAVNTAYQTALKTAKDTATSTALETAKETAKETAFKTAYQTAKDTATQTAGDTGERIAQIVADEAKKTAKETTVESLTTLLNALNQLTNGLDTINNSMADLDTGTSSLKDGIAALDNGIYQFNSQGIGKISDLVNGDVKTLEAKLKALGKLSLNYGTFDDLENGTEGVTKIIMVVDEINVKQANINSVDKTVENTNSLWERIKENINKIKNKK